MTPERILLIEADSDAGESLRDDLVLEGYAVEVERQGKHGLDRALAEAWDLLILGLDLPDMDGLQLLKCLRIQGSDLPVLIVTDRAREADKVLGLRTGADDYLTPPFGILELLARAEALIRRRRRLAGMAAHAVSSELHEVPNEDGASFWLPGTTWTGNGDRSDQRSPSRRRWIRFGNVEVDPGARTVHRGGTPVSLSPKEMDLLLALLARQGTAVSRATLLEEVWEGQVPDESRTVDTHMGELRKKLESDPAQPRHLITVRKVGYRLQP